MCLTPRIGHRKQDSTVCVCMYNISIILDTHLSVTIIQYSYRQPLRANEDVQVAVFEQRRAEVKEVCSRWGANTSKEKFLRSVQRNDPEDRMRNMVLKDAKDLSQSQLERIWQLNKRCVLVLHCVTLLYLVLMNYMRHFHPSCLLFHLCKVEKYNVCRVSVICQGG